MPLTCFHSMLTNYCHLGPTSGLFLDVWIIKLSVLDFCKLLLNFRMSHCGAM